MEVLRGAGQGEDPLPFLWRRLLMIECGARDDSGIAASGRTEFIYPARFPTGI